MSWWRSLKAAVSGTYDPSPAERRLIAGVARGWTLRSQRHLDGQKLYELRSPAGVAQEVPYAVVQRLLAHKLLTTNQKFPAATFLLTDKGKALLKGDDTLACQGLADIVHFDV